MAKTFEIYLPDTKSILLLMDESRFEKIGKTA